MRRRRGCGSLKGEREREIRKEGENKREREREGKARRETENSR